MKLNRLKNLIIAFLLIIGALLSHAQDPSRFQKELEVLTGREYNFSPGKELVVFAGSSSVRMWKDAQSVFPNYNVINNGFGGSHFSDLLHYYNELVVRHRPDILFIYEGDNDIASGKDPRKVRDEARLLVQKIQQDLPQTRIVLIAAKPSIARWEFKRQYEQLNRYLERIAKRNRMVEFAGMWDAMTDNEGEVYRDIFVDDNLHLNEKGYEIWEQVIGRHLEGDE